MKNKFSPEIQNEIDDIFEKIHIWKELFYFKVEFYFDGWAIFLREKNLYPRSIVIFKSYSKTTYSLKSFEIHLHKLKKEEFREIYSEENIRNHKDLLKELKEVIYGKDLLKNASKTYKNAFLQ